MRRLFILAIAVMIVFLFFGSLPIGETSGLPDGFKSYRVKKGDTLSKIAPKFQHDLIMKINRIDENHLPVGKEIIIPTDNENKELPNFCPVPEKTEIKSAKIIIIFLDIQYFGMYEKGHLEFWGPVCSGKNGYETPKGEYKVLWKRKKYFSRKYNNTPMPYAICISDNGYFLHQQSLTGRPSSHGCVRLLINDVQKIFYRMETNNPVIIR